MRVLNKVLESFAPQAFGIEPQPEHQLPERRLRAEREPGQGIQDLYLPPDPNSITRGT